MRRFAKTLPIWLLLMASAGCRTAIEGPAPDLLAKGNELFAAKQYDEARRHFDGIREYHLDAEEAEEALLRLAQCDHRLDDGGEAFQKFQKLVDDYPNTRFAPEIAESQYALGVDFLDGKMPGFLFFGTPREKGIEILEHMQIHFRHHPLADDALMKVALFQIGEKDHAEAVETLRRLLSDYPRSNHTLRARYELGHALMVQSRGAVYDQRLLYEARGAYNDFVLTAEEAGQAERYAKQIKAARERMAFATARMAERQYEIGRFFERRGEPNSAIHHYELCIRDYKETEWARRSRQRVSALRPTPKVTRASKEKSAG